MNASRKRLGDFQIVREIGRGGMGVVYEAVQVSLGRRVALKVLPPRAAPDQQYVERFQREAQAVARLDHPNIVPIYARGTARSTHYYAMKLVEGRPLSDVVAGTRARRAASGTADRGPEVSRRDFRKAARLIAQVAHALEYAHSRGVVHRDIKPSNLILIPEGQVMITDFGLARLLGAPTMTISGQLLGTPVYMSPEQIRVRQQRIDHRTDIYSLGVTLYELLTLETPFRGPTPQAVLHQILDREPAPPRRLDPRIPKALQTICLKAMEKDPGRRYQSAALLAQDLSRFLKGLPITGRPVGPVGRLRRRAARHPRLTAVMAAGAVTLLVASYFAMQGYRLRGQVPTETKVELQMSYMGLLAQARTALDTDAYLVAKEKLLQAAKIRWSPALHVCCWQLLRRFWDTPDQTFTGNTGQLECLAVSDDGDRLAAGSVAGIAKVWEVRTGRELCTLGSSEAGIAWSVAFSPGAETLAVGHENGMGLWDLGSGTSSLKLEGAEAGAPIRALDFSPDGGLLVAAGGHPGKVTLWNPATGQTLWSRSADSTDVSSVAFSPDGRTIASGAGQNVPEIKLWDAGGGQERLTLEGHTSGIYSLAFSPDGRLLASGSEVGDSTIRLWDVASGEERLVLSGHTDRVNCLDFSPNGAVLASSADDRRVLLWEIPSGLLLRTLYSSGDVTGLSFAPDGAALFVASRSGAIETWVSPADTAVRVLQGQEALAAAGFQDSDFSGASDKSVAQVGGPRLAALIKDEVRYPVLSPDGTLLAARLSGQGAQNVHIFNTVRIWDASTGRERGTLGSHRSWVTDIAFSPDGALLATSSHDHTARLWDVSTAQELVTLDLADAEPLAVAFSPDGRTLACRSSDLDTHLFDLRAHDAEIAKWLAAAGVDADL